MKILVIAGSPRANGNTFKALKLIEKRMAEHDQTLEFDYVQLSKTNLEPCKGCYLCIAKGEEYCPLKDDRKQLEIKMKQADALIFASPVYTYNVSWIMKNFLDRFAYCCHRPLFHGKKAMVVVTTGAVGLGFVKFLMSFMLGTMGFVTCAKAGLTYAARHEKNEKRTAKEIKALETQADLFLRHLWDKKPVKPTILKLLAFKLQRKAFAKAPETNVDYRFWKENGWLDKNEDYFYTVQVGFIQNAVATLISKLKL